MSADLTHEIETALAAFARENAIDRQEAINRILRDWLTQQGYLSSGQEGIPPYKLNASNDD